MLVAAGTVGMSYTLPVTGAIVVLLAVLVVSCRQVIAAFPGGGAYAVAGRHLGTLPSLVAAGSQLETVSGAETGLSGVEG